MDVARKVVILARGCGLRADLASLEVTSLVPEPLRGETPEDFMARLPEVGSSQVVTLMPISV